MMNLFLIKEACIKDKLLIVIPFLLLYALASYYAVIVAEIMFGKR